MLQRIIHLTERLVPPRLHRAIMPFAHRIRHRWRRFRGTPIAGVTVMVTNPAGELLLLRHSYGPPVWGLPGGGLKAGEDPLEAARREVHEELAMSLDTMQPLGTLREKLSGSPHTAYLFVATSEQTPVPDAREVVEARFFNPATLPDRLGKVSARRIAAWEQRRAEHPA